MYKPSVRTLLLIVGALVLLLAGFFAGGIALSAAYAAHTNATSTSSAQPACDKQNPKCQGNSRDTSVNQMKAVVTVSSVSGNTIQGTILQPADKHGSALTILTTSNTSYKPDQSVVAAGKTIFVAGVVNSDGSITAQIIGSYDPTEADFGGVIISVDSATITIQAKDSTHTILVTANTLYLKISSSQPGSKTEQKQPASRDDLKVGETIEAHGKLNSAGSLVADNVLIVLAGTSTK